MKALFAAALALLVYVSPSMACNFNQHVIHQAQMMVIHDIYPDDIGQVGPAWAVIDKLAIEYCARRSEATFTPHVQLVIEFKQFLSRDYKQVYKHACRSVNKCIDTFALWTRDKWVREDKVEAARLELQKRE